jgi:thioredoxin-dependent peroxiredoxin
MAATKKSVPKKKIAPPAKAPAPKAAAKTASGKIAAKPDATSKKKVGKVAAAAKVTAKAAKTPVKVAAPPAKGAPPPSKLSTKSTKSLSKPASTKQSPPASPEAPSLGNTVKRAAAKVTQLAAAAAIKLLDADMGRPAPAFELSDEKGERVSSADLAGKPYLLYFYPKDDTPGCTKEACDIRDNFGRFGQRGLRVFGVSPDSQQSHAKFGKKYGLPFSLLADPDKTLASAYGVWGEKNNYGKKYMGIIRSTFLIGADGTIKKAYRGVKVDGHVHAILEDAAALL